MVTPIATRFVDWDIPELSTLQDSKVYQLRVQLNEGTPMSRQQKNWLTDNVNSNTYFKRAVPLMGYRFDFSDILKLWRMARQLRANLLICGLPPKPYPRVNCGIISDIRTMIGVNRPL